MQSVSSLKVFFLFLFEEKVFIKLYMYFKIIFILRALEACIVCICSSLFYCKELFMNVNVKVKHIIKTYLHNIYNVAYEFLWFIFKNSFENINYQFKSIHSSIQLITSSHPFFLEIGKKNFVLE